MNLYDPLDVSYCHLDIMSKDGYISGFALWYLSKSDAEKGFQKFHDYISLSGKVNRKSSFEFQELLDGKYQLRIEIVIGDNKYETLIKGIEHQYVRKLQKSLQSFQYFFVTAGYTESDGNKVILPINRFNFFRSELIVDGKVYHGKKIKEWPYYLFRNDEVVLQEEA